MEEMKKILYISYDGKSKLTKKDFTKIDVQEVCEKIINKFKKEIEESQHNIRNELGILTASSIISIPGENLEIKFEMIDMGTKVDFSIIQSSPVWMSFPFVIDSKILFTKKGENLIENVLFNLYIRLSLEALEIKKEKRNERQ